ncbi:MAG: flagellar protein FliL [Alcaligenaceae bacterium]|nr:flagellar protein FliL [Alcaligenaceae bacterium]
MAAKESSGIMKWLLLIILVLILVVGAVVGTLFLSSKFNIGLGNLASAVAPAGAPMAPTAPAAPPPYAGPPIFTPLEAFTVTLRGETRNRILYTGITLRMGDEQSSQMIRDYMPEVRDRVLRLLSQQSPEFIQTPEGRAALVKALSDALQAPYSPHVRGPLITDVLFTAFVIQ